MKSKDNANLRQVARQQKLKQFIQQLRLPKGRRTWLELPNDVWIIIIEILRKSARPQDVRKSLIPLSTTCKQLRLLCRPYILDYLVVRSNKATDAAKITYIGEIPHLALRHDGRVPNKMKGQLLERLTDLSTRNQQLASKLSLIYMEGVGSGIRTYKSLLDDRERLWLPFQLDIMVLFNFPTILVGLRELSISYIWWNSRLGEVRAATAGMQRLWRIFQQRTIT